MKKEKVLIRAGVVRDIFPSFPEEIRNSWKPSIQFSSARPHEKFTKITLHTLSSMVSGIWFTAADNAVFKIHVLFKHFIQSIT